MHIFLILLFGAVIYVNGENAPPEVFNEDQFDGHEIKDASLLVVLWRLLMDQSIGHPLGGAIYFRDKIVYSAIRSPTGPPSASLQKQASGYIWYTSIYFS